MFKFQPPFVKHLDKSCKIVLLIHHALIYIENSFVVLQLTILGTLELWSDHDEDQIQVASLVMVGSEWQGGNKLDL